MNIIERLPGDRLRLEQLARNERDALQRDRLRSVMLAIDGVDANAIAAQVGRCRRFVQDWAYAYRDGGIEAIKPGKAKGKPCRLDDRQLAELRERLHPADDAKAVDHAFCRKGAEVAKAIRQHFGVSYSTGGAYKLLRREGFSPLRPRPVHPKHDPAAETKFKHETAPLLSAG